MGQFAPAVAIAFLSSSALLGPTLGNMGTLVERLEKRLRRHVLAELPSGKGQRHELERLELRELLTAYGNWRYRCPLGTPRNVLISRELQRELEDRETPEALMPLIQRIKDGDDLKPFLSRNVKVALDRREGTTHHQRKDLDLLLAEWGVHHLHLSMLIQGDGFAKRTGDLLFVVLRPDDAYLIGIYPHGSWTKRSVAERAVRNWPEAELFLRSKYAIGLTHEWDESESATLRKAGLTQSMMIDGHVYSPQGQTLGGTSWTISRRVMNLMWELTDWKARGDDRLVEIAGGSFAYWLPAIQDDRCGFLSGNQFVPVADLP
jgi:hypothetical protein